MPTQDHAMVVLTANIVAAHVANNSISINDVSAVISSVHSALAKLGAPVEAKPVELKPAVSVRSSIKPDHIVSMIDGRPYKMLKRHLSQNGHTPQSYREAYNLPRDYPMTAPDYAAKRSDLARKSGLGRRRQALNTADGATEAAPDHGTTAAVPSADV